MELPDIAFPTCSLLHAHHQQATMLYTHCVWALALREREEDNGGLPGMVAPCSAVTYLVEDEQLCDQSSVCGHRRLQRLLEG